MSATDTDARADALVERLTLAEKLRLVHSHFAVPEPGHEPLAGAIGSAAYTPGVPRLGIPALQESDASLGVTNPRGVRAGADATALPSSILLAATFDAELARRSGAAVGAEARAAGFNVQLAGGANLVREPRCGRNFEYLSEDPLLTGVLAGASIAGIQDEGIVSTIKHFALNAQETGRVVMSADIGEAALRESDLLAFQLAIERGGPGSVMTGYNKVNGTYCAEHELLLSTVLKGDWAYPGFVMSDWGGTHSTVASALAGLDRESGEELDSEVFFGEPLRAAVEDGRVPMQRLDDMVRRILRSLAAVGALEPEGRPAPRPDLAAHHALAQEVAEQGIVLLRNDGVLPFGDDVRRVALIGAHADRGVLSGGGSSQVTPLGSLMHEDEAAEGLFPPTYHPSSPLGALRGALAAGARVDHDPGSAPAAAAALAAQADVAVVIARQWTREGADVPDLALPDGQGELIAAVAAANPRTVVALVTGGPVTMPWLDDVAAVLAAWYPGSRGAEALAAILAGAVAPSGRLPVTFPRDVAQLPRPAMRDPATTTSMPGAPAHGAFAEDYDVEGSDVGYRWFEREGHDPLFPFGFGLSYTSFSYDELEVGVDDAGDLTMTVTVTNTGDRDGIETPQLYAAPADGRWPPRLVGWGRAALGPGESARATAVADPRLLARFDPAERAWVVDGGPYVVLAGPDARSRPLRATVDVPARRLAP